MIGFIEVRNRDGRMVRFRADLVRLVKELEPREGDAHRTLIVFGEDERDAVLTTEPHDAVWAQIVKARNELADLRDSNREAA